MQKISKKHFSKCFRVFCVLDDFFLFSKKMYFLVFLVHPTVVSVLLSASVERCFVSRMRDFFCIGATILTRPEIQCFLYAEYFSTHGFQAILGKNSAREVKGST